jgi:hypothetical protein
MLYISDLNDDVLLLYYLMYNFIALCVTDTGTALISTDKFSLSKCVSRSIP